MFHVSTFHTDGEGVSVPLTTGTARTIHAALRGAWELIGGIPDAEACIRRHGPGLVGYLQTNDRGELAEAEVLHTGRHGGTLVTPLNPRGPMFAV